MLALGVIEQSSSPWHGPLVLTPKHNVSVHLSIHYQQLNEVILFGAYTMLQVDALLDKIGGTQVLSTLDLTKGYWPMLTAPKWLLLNHWGCTSSSKYPSD